MSSLFGNLGASTNKPTTSLFGASTSQPAAPAASTGTSLFGGLNNNTSKPATGGLFGGAASTQTQASTAPASGQSLFGGGAASGTSLFGAANTTQPQQQQQQQQAATTTGGGLFGATATAVPASNNVTQQQQQQQQQQQSQSQHSGAYFDSLLEKSRKRARGETALEELPSLQLGLGDLRDRIRRLGPAARDDAVDGRAQYVLAGSGVDLGAAVKDLTYLDVQTKRERQQPSAPSTTDVEGYLANLQTQTTLNMIADGLARSASDFDAFLEEHVTMEWDVQRKRIYQHFGLKPREPSKTARDGLSTIGGSTTEQGSFGRSRRSKAQSTRTSRADVPSGSVFGRSGMQKSVIGSSGPIGSRHQMAFVDVEKSMEAAGGSLPVQDDRVRREKQGKFAEKVQNLNAARIQKQTYPILNEFSAVEGQTQDEHVEHVVKAYRAVVEITGEKDDSEPLSAQGALKERHFAEAYLDESPSSGKTAKINKQILSGACRHLEMQFFQDLETLIAKNPREANLGGVPNVMSKIRAYIRLKAARKDLVPDDTDLQKLGDDYVWALVFYLLRSGHVSEAVQYVAENNIAFRAIDRNFITYITDYSNSPDRRLRRELQDRINNEYNQRVRIAPEHSIDPFRMACYNVIGRCDTTKRALDGLYHAMEDWLWLQFVLAREVSRMEEVASDVYGLKEVQETIDSVVTKHAQGTTGFGVFFYIQVLAGRFEQAISYLYTHQYVDAVHFAIAMDYYGLLRIAGPSAPEGDLLTFSTRGLPQLSFSRMIGYYTQDFRAANVVAAVDYLALICLNSDLPGEAGQLQASQCHEALRELVLETREFAQLLGDVQKSGARIKGAIEERIQLLGLADTDDFMRTVTVQAAGVADDNGRITDAVLLYHLAEEYDYVIAICNRALSDAIAVEIGQEHGTLVPAKSRPGADGADDQSENSPALSLTSCDDPVKLASIIGNIYYGNSMFRSKLSAQNWNTLEVLVEINRAKSCVAAAEYSKAMDILAPLGILPINAQGDSTLVRQCAAKYSSLDQTISRLVPNLIIWTIHSASAIRKNAVSGPYAGNDVMKRELVVGMANVAKDLMMYSGFLKYRLPAEVNDTLARIAAE